MARRQRAIDVLNEMKPASLRRLALAVFLLFGAMGPLMVLMESSVEIRTWSFIAVQTLASGGMAASIVLFGRKRWWLTVLIVAFWTNVLLMNSGIISIVGSDEAVRVRLQGSDSEQLHAGSLDSIMLDHDRLASLYTQRSLTGLLTVSLLVLGYISFIRAIRMEIRERARLETEMKIAQDIQQSLQPQHEVVTSWCDIAGTTLSASEVGGDYFDILRLDEDVLLVVIADVTGHGVGAGILSAMTKSAIHTLAAAEREPRLLLTSLNRTIHELTERKMFVTCGMVLLDRRRGSVSVSTAGHPPVLRKKKADSSVDDLRTISMGLGITKDAEFTQIDFEMTSGDVLVLYTDGVTEAVGRKRELFGLDRLRTLLRSETHSARDLANAITHHVASFSSTSTLEDDLSVLVVRLT